MYKAIVIFSFPLLLLVLIVLEAQAEDDKNTTVKGDCLYLTPLLLQEKYDEARSFAEVHHPDFHVPSYSGFLNVDEKYNSQMFFWYFPSLKSSDSPLILWLFGGPGLPGLLAIFYSNGPFELINQTVSKRAVSWNNDYNVLYVDNPVGSGYSHTNSKEGYSTDQISAADNLYRLLTQFLLMFPDLQRSDLYVAGESYGAKFTIHLCYKIHRSNQNSSNPINLKGFGIFSGFFDPKNQHNYGKNFHYMGLLDEAGLQTFLIEESNLSKHIKDGNWVEAVYGHSSMFLSLPNRLSLLYNHTGIFNCYNLKRFDEKIEYMVANVSLISQYLTDKKNALHLGAISDPDVNTAANFLLNDQIRSSSSILEEILRHYRGVFVAGQLDIVVSYPMLSNALNKLNFTSAVEWPSAKRHKWYVDGKLAGYYKTAGRLTEVLVLDSGHFIPIDQPERAFDAIKRLINNSWA